MVTAKVHQVRYAMITVDEAVQEVRQAGGSDALVTKFRNAVQRQIKVMWECWDESAYADISQQISVRWFPTTRMEQLNGEYVEVLAGNGEWRVSWFNIPNTEQPYQWVGEKLTDAMDFATKLVAHKDNYWKYEIAIMRQRDREARLQLEDQEEADKSDTVLPQHHLEN
jgi:hypothetical protein